MKKRTVKLVVVASIPYYAILYLVSGLFPAEFTPPPYFLVSPLLVLVFIFARDLARRATVPTGVAMKNPPSRTLSRDVEQLTRRIEVGSSSSQSYFDSLLQARLRGVLVERLALETGIERERVRELLENPRLGRGLVRNDRLYRLLYTRPPEPGPARVKLLNDIATMLEDWKP